MKTRYLPKVVKDGRLTSSQYSGLHRWVERQLGKPSECENCMKQDASKYEWANLSGDYLKDVSDWARLCGWCHRIIDNSPMLQLSQPGPEHPGWTGNFCKQGHERTEENTYIKRDGAYLTRICRICQRAYVNKNHKATRLKRKAAI